MATVEKDFKIKKGLIVEGTTGTINNHDILTKKQDDQNYIIGLIGGSSDSENTPNTVVKRDSSGDFAAGTITADLVGNVIGNADTATTLETSRTIELTGDVTGSVSFNGSQNVQIQAVIDGSFATDAEVSTAKQEAIDAAASDATTKANAAQANAETFATNADSALYTTVTSDIATAKSQANTYAEDLVSGEATDRYTAITNAINTEVQDRNSAINTAISNLGSDTTAAIATAKSEAIADANAHADAAVAALVDSAPAMLDTLNELAEAIANNPNYATDVANLVATKADTSYVNSEISDLDLAAQGYASTAQSNAESFATTAANNAQDAAETYAENLISTEVSNRNSAISNAISTEVSDRNNAIDQAINTEVTARNNAISSAVSTEVTNRNNAITSAVNALTTSDIEEGSNQYFTTSRAKSAAAALITSATKTNIVITGDENGLTITAENGVADSTTSDLREGSNLYFTNARAVSALEAVTPNFVEVDLNSVAKQVAASTEVGVASEVTAYSWAKADYRTAKFLVKTAYGTHTDVAEVLLTLDTSDNIAITEYALVGTNGSAMTVSADVNGSDVRLRVSTVNNNSTVTVVGTLLA